MDERIRLLGILQLALGAFGVMGGLIAFVVLGGTAGIIEVAAGGEREATFVVWLLGALAFGVGFINLLFAVPSVVSGIGLLTGKPWGPFLALVASALNLINIPFGTAIGIYGLWVLLPRPPSPPPAA